VGALLSSKWVAVVVALCERGTIIIIVVVACGRNRYSSANTTYGNSSSNNSAAQICQHKLAGPTSAPL
jgi:hypothetical protein